MDIQYPSDSWKDYELLDSGDGQKLERFGRYCLIRPEPKALWEPTLSSAEWSSTAHTRFKPGAGFGKAGKEDSGTWEILKKMDEQWYIGYRGQAPGLDFSLRLGLTSFKHVGVFPEQAPNWEFIYSGVKEIRQNLPAGAVPKVLNLFAYTGAASLAAKAAGADVTHLDSVRQGHTLGGGRRPQVRPQGSQARQPLQRNNPGSSGIRPRSRRREVEAGPVPVRHAQMRRGHTGARERLHGAQPVFQRVLPSPWGDYRTRGPQGRRRQNGKRGARPA